MKKRIVSIFLILCILLCSMPTYVFSATAESGATVTYTAIDGTAGNSGESYSNIFDGKNSYTRFTKWCVQDITAGNPYVVIKASSAVMLNNYTFITGNDTASHPERNPKAWTVYGSNDYNESAKTGTWAVVHTVTNGEMPSANFTGKSFRVNDNTLYKYFKIVITEVASTENNKLFQLCGIEILGQVSSADIVCTPIDGTENDSNDSQNYDKLIDGNKNTKWCYSSENELYIVMETSRPVAVNGYTFTTGNDTGSVSVANGRNPKTWQLYGCNDYNETDKTGSWVVLHGVLNDTTMEDKDSTDYSFYFENSVEYQYYKLVIKASQNGEMMQLSEMKFSAVGNGWYTPVGGKPISLGTGAMLNPVSGKGLWQHVYFGNYEGNPMDFRILQKSTNDFTVKRNTPTLFLENAGFLKYMCWSYGEEGTITRQWRESLPRQELNGTFLTEAFNTEEQNVLHKSRKNTRGVLEANTAYAYSETFEDKVFILSFDEYVTRDYGFGGALDEFHTNIYKRIGPNDYHAEEYYTRTRSNDPNRMVVLTGTERNPYDKGHSIYQAARYCPAINIPLSSILFTKNVNGDVNGYGNDDYTCNRTNDKIKVFYKLSVLNSALGASVTGNAVKTGDKIKIPYSVTGDNATQLSVMILDKEYKAGNSNSAALKYYAKLKDVTSQKSGTAEFTLPSEFSSKTPGKDYYIYVTAEDINGEKETDFASTPVLVTPKYPVTYKPGKDGKGSEQTDYKTTDTALTLKKSIFSRTNYTQTGWSLTDGGAKVYDLGASYTANSELVLYPVWTRSAYTVTYSAGKDGTGSIGAGTKTHGTNFTLSKNTFTRTGYTQVGWATSDGGAKVYDLGGTYSTDADITLYPVWSLNTYTVTYSAGANGTGSIGADTKTHGTALTLSKNTFTRTGYTQVGWATSDGGAKVYDLGGSYTANANVTLYPTWKVNKYTITVKPENGEADITLTQDYNTTVTAPTLTRQGYAFDGWDKTFPSSMPAENMTVTAKWKDVTAPTGEIKVGTNGWKTFINNITFGLFFKNTQEVTITATDNSGDAVKIEYLLSNQEMTETVLAAATFTAYSDKLTLSPNNKYVVYAKLTDETGNVAYINSNGIVLDNIVPVIAGITNGETYCSAQTVTVTDDYIDTVKVNDNSVELNTNGQFTLSPAEGEQKIVATDGAGNKAEMTVTVNNGHTNEWHTENGKYWAKCKYCDYETEKKSVPEITVNGANRVCSTQDYNFTATSSDNTVVMRYGYEFAMKGDGGIPMDFKNGIYSDTISSDILENDASFVLVVNAETSDGYVVTVRKTVQILQQHTGGTADCKHKPKCDVCCVEYGAVNPNNHTGEKEWTTKNATQHEQKWNCCGTIAVALENHEWEGGVCKDCGAISDTPVASINFTLDTSTYAIDKKIVDLKVSGTNAGLVDIGGDGYGYGDGYIITENNFDFASSGIFDRNITFADDTTYYLFIMLVAQEGYSLENLTATDIALNGTVAENLQFVNTELGVVGVARFKLPQLSNASVNFTLDTSTYAIDKKIVDLKVSGTNAGLVDIGGDGYGYGDGYIITENNFDFASSGIFDRNITFADDTTYYLFIMLVAQEGYSLENLTATDIALNGTVAENLQFVNTELGVVGVARFKLPQLSNASVNFTLDTSTYAIDKKIVDLKVSGTNAGLVDIGGDGYGYGDGYIITENNFDFASSGIFDRNITFADDTTYYLFIMLVAQEGYSLENLTATDIALNGTVAENLQFVNTELGVVGVARFKLPQLSNASVNFTLDTSTYAIDKKIVDLKVSGTNAGLVDIGGDGYGYGNGFIVAKGDNDIYNSGVYDSNETFAVDTTYCLGVVLIPQEGYSLEGLTATDIALNGTVADSLQSVSTNTGVMGIAFFKLNKLSAAPKTHITSANFTLGGYAVGSKVTESTLSMSVTPAGALVSPVKYVDLDDTVNGYTATNYLIGTDFDLSEGSMEPIFEDSEKFESGITYYLEVIMIPAIGYDFEGLTKNNVKLGNLTAIDLAFFEGNMAVAVFKLQPFPDYSWYDADETDYTISTVSELIGFANLVNGTDGKTATTFEGKTVKLANDIDLSGIANWTPIGMDPTHPFKGTFNGQGNTVSNLTINSDATFVGLFGFVNTGTVKNLAVSGSVSATSRNSDYTGGIVGIVGGNIENCSFSGSVTGNGYSTGGIAGAVIGEILKCSNFASVGGNGFYIGGVVGYGTSIRYCYNQGSVSGDRTVTLVGGIAGGIAAEVADATMYSCYNAGTVSATGGGAAVGGVVGEAAVSRNRSIIIDKVYYLDSVAEKGIGTSTTEEDSSVTDNSNGKSSLAFNSGEVAWLLQNAVNNADGLVWGQQGSADGDLPILTDDEDFRVLPVKDGESIVNYSVLRKGDANNDSVVDIYDYQQSVNIALSESNTKKETEKYDLNGDGAFDILDCNIAEKQGMSDEDYSILLQKTLNSELGYFKNADFDDDGVVDVLDVAGIEKMLAGHRVKIIGDVKKANSDIDGEN